MSSPLPRKPSRLHFLSAGVAAWLFLFPLAAVQFQQSHEDKSAQPFIDRTDVTGYRRISIATIRAQISSRPGDPYNAQTVQRDAQALRDTGYFTEVRVTVEDSPERPNGKIVEFVVREKPIIRRVEYKGIQSITEADILNAFKENKISLSVDDQFDEQMLPRAAAVIKGLLSKHGRPSATVKPSYERIAGTNAVTIVFAIEGPEATPAK
jgi:outer membrane protein insertion porin family